MESPTKRTTEDRKMQRKLKERLDKALEDINSALEEEERVIIGFLDESRPKTTSNTVRVWAFEDPEKKRNTTNYQANTFGFYPLNGESVVEFKENSKKESVCKFFERIREENPEEKIVMILDNFESHRAKLAEEKAEFMGGGKHIHHKREAKENGLWKTPDNHGVSNLYLFLYSPSVCYKKYRLKLAFTPITKNDKFAILKLVSSYSFFSSTGLKAQ